MKRPSSSNPLPDHVFFTDRDLGKLVPRLLEDAGLAVERHDDHFPPTTPDTTWLKHAGEQGWVAITHNKGIRYVTAEREMVARAGVRLFILIGHHTQETLAVNLLNTLDQVGEFLERHEGPFIAKVMKAPKARFKAGKPGRVDLWWEPGS